MTVESLLSLKGIGTMKFFVNFLHIIVGICPQKTTKKFTSQTFFSKRYGLF